MKTEKDFIESCELVGREQPNRWANEFNLQTFDVKINGKVTDQLIMNGLRHVVTTSPQYQLLPNQEVEERVTPMMEKLECTKFDFGEDKPNWAYSVETKPYMITDKNMDMMTLLYKFKSDVVVDPKTDDKVHLGIGVRNSINKAFGFGAFVFTFRHVCRNFMPHLLSERMLQVTDFEKVSMGEAGRMNQGINVATAISMKHTKQLKVDVELDQESKIEESIKKVIKGADNFIKRYQVMLMEKFTQEQAVRVVTSFPKQIIENSGIRNYIEIDEAKQKIKLLSDKTTYSVVQDLTQAITRSKLGFNSALNQYKKVDSILVRA